MLRSSDSIFIFSVPVFEPFYDKMLSLANYFQLYSQWLRAFWWSLEVNLAYLERKEVRTKNHFEAWEVFNLRFRINGSTFNGFKL